MNAGGESPAWKRVPFARSVILSPVPRHRFRYTRLPVRPEAQALLFSPFLLANGAPQSTIKYVYKFLFFSLRPIRRCEIYWPTTMSVEERRAGKMKNRVDNNMSATCKHTSFRRSVRLFSRFFPQSIQYRVQKNFATL